MPDDSGDESTATTLPATIPDHATNATTWATVRRTVECHAMATVQWLAILAVDGASHFVFVALALLFFSDTPLVPYLVWATNIVIAVAATVEYIGHYLLDMKERLSKHKEESES